MNLQLHSLFTNHAVLQRGVPVPVWGSAGPEQRISVAIGDRQASTVSDSQGNWKAWLEPLDAGGPHVLRASTETGEVVEVNDLLVGDVYLCSGQSNMEWPVSGAVNGAAECAAANFPRIRLFHVPKRSAPAPRTDVETAWAVCSPQTVANFSAVGYFFGREIHQTQKIPIGLINASWGGTVCEAWTSENALTNAPALAPIADRLRWAATKDKDPAVMERHVRALRAWETEFCHPDPGNQGEGWGWASESFDDKDWETMAIPTAWERTGLNIDGAVWFRREVTIPPAWKNRDVTLSLGTVDDFDDTYVNGVRIGGIDVRTPDAWAIPRVYAVPGALLKPGRNVLAIRVFDRINDGGIIGPASQLKLSSEGESIPLAGAWRYKIELRLEPRQGVPEPPVAPMSFENQNCPTALFNGMIHPLIPYAIRGAIWYQGESNRSRADQYRTLFPLMIKNWRDAWNIGDFPFFFVELARWNGRQSMPAESELAELREAQACALALPAVGRATIIDTGDAQDIHPIDKQTVGHRLALAARARVYGEKIESAGPTYASMKREADAIRLTFTHISGGLTSSDGDRLRGFAIAGIDRRFHWARAQLEDNTVVVRSDRVPNPVAVRYGWADNPDCNLCNGAGIPASPFRTDEWPGLTLNRG